jgi:probable F420-dependent oxidoreductase
VRLGIVSPVLTMLPRAHARWEETAGIDEVKEIARAADRLGYEHMTCSEHVGVPGEITTVRGGRYWDPLATFGFIAAHTERIRFATYVLVLGYHHPLEIAKRYGTLDRITGGRLVLGVGVGTLREEFELLGVPFEDRGPRADDALRALREAFGKREPAYRGPFYDFSGFVVDPCGVQQRVPIWVGGRTPRSLRRAVELADGWAPFGLGLEEVSRFLEDARTLPSWGARAQPLEVVLVPDRPIDPLGDPDGAVRTARLYQEAGATIFTLRLRHSSPQQYIEQLEAMAALDTA